MGVQSGKTHRWVVPALLVAAALSASPSSAGAKPKPKAPPADVVATGGPVAVLWAWGPSTVTIPAGGRVRWTNDSGAPHNVAAYGDAWDEKFPVEEGTPVVRRFTEPGTYLYYCDVLTHGFVVGDTCIGMCGSVEVE